MIFDADSPGFHRDYLDKLTDKGGDLVKKLLATVSDYTRDPIPHAYDITLRLEQLDRNGFDPQDRYHVAPMLDGAKKT